MADETPEEREQAELAAREAAGIGGATSEQDLDPAQLAVRQGGGGEAEGFEQAEEELIENATHGDQQSAHAILHDQGIAEEPYAAETGEADEERSSERADEESPSP